MGKIILEFDSNEEMEDARVSMDGWKWKYVVKKIDDELRKTTKYGGSVILEGHESASKLERDIAEKYREIIHEILSSQNLNFD